MPEEIDDVLKDVFDSDDDDLFETEGFAEVPVAAAASTRASLDSRDAQISVSVKKTEKRDDDFDDDGDDEDGGRRRRRRPIIRPQEGEEEADGSHDSKRPRANGDRQTELEEGKRTFLHTFLQSSIFLKGEMENSPASSSLLPNPKMPRRYFFLQCNYIENIQSSLQNSVWTCSKVLEKRLNDAFDVLVFFSLLK